MLIVKNPYENLWKKHLSIDEMDMILEVRNMEEENAAIFKPILFPGKPIVSESKSYDAISG